MSDTVENEDSISTSYLEPGSVLAGRYSVRQLLGTGGMANVYLANDNYGRQAVALKVLHSGMANDKSYVERFIREARLMMKIDCPQVVRAFDVGTDGSNVFLVMEYLQADSLDKILQIRTLTVQETCYVITEVARALAAIHEQGIIFRDLKPANILISLAGEVKITDFGVAREPGSRLTGASTRLGSICYIAPESWLGKKATSLVDLYALGIVVYEMLAGKVPFDSPYPGTVMEQHLTKPIEPLNDFPKATPIWLSSLTRNLLAKKPGGRPTAYQVIEICKKNEVSAEYADSAICSLAQIVGTHESSHLSQVTDAQKVYLRGEGRRIPPALNRTYIFQLNATQVFREKEIIRSLNKRKKTVTISIPLPRHSALVFELEKPSRDFYFMGFFLASLQIFDGILTVEGIKTFSIESEGNAILRYLMGHYGVETTMLVSKGTAVLFVLALTLWARKMTWIKNVISFLSIFYLFAAIIPWLIALRLNGTI